VENVVSKIYNQLYQVEKKVRKGKVYPIHKKLVFADQDLKDVYDWLTSNIDINIGSNVLDAGCGVGYGACLIAERCKANVTGISISEKEIAHANSYSQKKGLGHQVTFKLKSFDNLLPQKYDTIFAVESIKHSLHLEKTLDSLKQALKPNGQLVIIEDFYLQENISKNCQQYINDWHLIDAFRMEDYFKTLDREQCKYIDLTSYMPPKKKYVVNGKLAMTQLLSRLNGDNMNIHKIFKGGYYLDRLYLQGLMRYGVLIYTPSK